jgi:diguanylate cyclase (GGDEF)-like protein/putative nucleotidyltransferase with HDIG domain
VEPVRPGSGFELDQDTDAARADRAGRLDDSLTGLLNHSAFHERLAEEIRRANRHRSTVGLLIVDIDHFRRLNDSWGHSVGDEVLRGVAVVARDTCRGNDVVCRLGGEEFAVILPGSSLEDAGAVAERLRVAIQETSFPGVDPVSVSIGVAACPAHASSPRDLTTCAQVALMEAKEAGRNRVEVYREPVFAPEDGGEPDAPMFVVGPEFESGAGAHDSHDMKDNGGRNIGWNGNGHGNGNGNGSKALSEPRSLAQLRMLHSLSAKLNRLNDVGQIGEAITTELRSLIDYHNCRVHLLEGGMLVPIAFRGELLEYQGETFAALLTELGEGVTGTVAVTGQTHYSPNAAQDAVAVDIPGTPTIDESLLVVPLKYGDRVIGTIGLSKLGVGQFDDDDKRLLEVMASNAAVAFENARLFGVEREAAETSRALLKLSQALTTAGDTQEVLDEAIRAIPSMSLGAEVSAWIQDPATGDFTLVHHGGFDSQFDHQLQQHVVPAHVATAFLQSVDAPFVMTKELVATVPEEHRLIEPIRDVLVAPMRWEPDGLGAFVILAPNEDSTFDERDLGLARGIADITSLALGNARRFDDLERAYVSTVEALANALEAQDAYTEAHCRALAKLAVTVGAEMGLEGERLKHLELGAVFHDIGKIGVPSEIIRKPGPLTTGERRLMERHTVIGAQILEPVPFLQKVIPIVRSSHERWDGHGYPEGASGESIPLESRIVFVCDAFHAMTTDRPYRAALPRQEALRRLRLGAGTQFDPEVVDVFDRLHEAGRIHLD